MDTMQGFLRQITEERINKIVLTTNDYDTISKIKKALQLIVNVRMFNKIFVIVISVNL